MPHYWTATHRTFRPAFTYTRWISDENRRGRVVVVRPPVDPELYALENELAEAVVARMTSWLRDQRVPYIDMNVYQYHSTDRSHIDWYDTEQATRDLGAEIARFNLIW